VAAAAAGSLSRGLADPRPAAPQSPALAGAGARLAAGGHRAARPELAALRAAQHQAQRPTGGPAGSHAFDAGGRRRPHPPRTGQTQAAGPAGAAPGRADRRSGVRRQRTYPGAAVRRSGDHPQPAGGRTPGTDARARPTCRPGRCQGARTVASSGPRPRAPAADRQQSGPARAQRHCHAAARARRAAADAWRGDRTGCPDCRRERQLPQGYERRDPDSAAGQCRAAALRNRTRRALPSGTSWR